MERDLSILSEKQKIAYLLRKQGYTYKQIAEKMGVCPNTANEYVKRAEARFLQYEQYHDERRKNDQPISFPLTRGELGEMISGLFLLEHDLVRRHGGWNIRTDWRGCLPYEIQIVKALLNRAQRTLYGKEAE